MLKSKSSSPNPFRKKINYFRIIHRFKKYKKTRIISHNRFTTFVWRGLSLKSTTHLDPLYIAAFKYSANGKNPIRLLLIPRMLWTRTAFLYNGRGRPNERAIFDRAREGEGEKRTESLDGDGILSYLFADRWMLFLNLSPHM